MALRESAPLGILTGQPHAMAFKQQRAEGERLGGRPIDALASLDRLAPAVEETVERLVQVEALRHRGDFVADLLQRREIDAGLAAARIVGIAGGLKARPAAVEPIGL